MNITTGLPMDQFWWIPLLITGGIIGIVAIILKKMDLF